MQALAALAAALAVTIATPLPTDDEMFPFFNESEGYLSDMQWPGPARGCAADAEGLEGGLLRLECALPAGHATLLFNRATGHLTLTCMAQEDGSPGGFSCEELQLAAGEKLQQHAERRVLRSLRVERCTLDEPLQRLLALVGAVDAEMVELNSVPSPLRPDHVRGLANVTHLRLIRVEANVTELPYEALTQLKTLERLDVAGGALQLAADGRRWAALPLRMLELTDGGLRALPPRAFRSLAQLRILSLRSNEIETIDENAFEGLSQLETLVLNSNQLAELPARSLLSTPRLRLLQLYDNRLQALPSLGHLQHLEEMWVNNKNESTLVLRENTFAGMSALRKLKLESCGLTGLPAGLLRGCRALAELLLTGNQLSEVPAELLLEQGALRKLDLSRNRLGVLPAGLLNETTALEQINLSRNRLRTLPRDLLHATTILERLDLATNRLDVLPNDVFRNLAKLKKLDLSTNNLTDLHPRVFLGLTSLAELSMSHNKLSLEGLAGGGVDPEGRLRSPLSSLEALTHLDLAHNIVRYFMEDWRDLRHLKILNLSYNEITRLSDTDMQLLSDAAVDVRHNKISRVRQLSLAEIDAAAGKLSGARFLLDNNPFHCDCHMYSFLVALQRPQVKQLFDLKDARCAAPPAVAGTALAATAPGVLLCALPVPEWPQLQCPANCTCALRPANNSLELICEAAPPKLQSLTRHVDAAVRLRLHTPPVDVAKLPPTVTVLDLSSLNLTSPPAASACRGNLTVDLSNNRLTGAPLALLEGDCQVVLGGNPLACDCEHRDSVAALRRHGARVVDYAALRCADGQWARGADPSTLCASRDALALGLGAGLAAALLVLVLFRFRTEVRLLLGRWEWFDFLLPKRDAAMLEKKYDLFVSFSHCDDAYVRDVLVPALEGGRRPLRLCLHYRDWEVGGYIPDQIHRSVAHSWRTVVVLSEDFVKSVWGRHEFRAAHGLERVIVLVLGDALDAMDADPELRAYKKTHTCIMASHPLVWDRIRDAVYRSRRAAPPTPLAGLHKAPRGALDVHLRDGKLVNEATPKQNRTEADSPSKLPSPLRSLVFFK